MLPREICVNNLFISIVMLIFVFWGNRGKTRQIVFVNNYQEPYVVQNTEEQLVPT